MKILVYGGGAVGLSLATFLVAAGEEVAVLARGETRRAILEEGIFRLGLFGESHAPPGSFAAPESLAELGDAAPFDYVLVCVKSFDSAAAAEDLARRGGLLGEAGRIVLVQNGWGNREVFAARLPWERVYNARVITGFTRRAPNRVEITVHADDMRVGSLVHPELRAGDLSAVAPICAAVARGGFPCSPTAEVGKYIWSKILYNCALNPLGAIFNVPYGALAEHAASRALMDDVINEGHAVMVAEGHATLLPDADAYRAAFYGQMVPTTAAHRSSTLQDLQAGRRTEIDALSGAIADLGEKHGIATPVNLSLVRMIKFMEGRDRAAKAGSANA